MLWRLVLSDRVSDSKREIEEEWSLGDVMDAHLALDVAEDMAILVDQEVNPRK